MGGTLLLMIILQVPVTLSDKYQGTCISGFPDFLDSKSCRSNDGAMIIKHYHCVLNPWVQTINVSTSSYWNAVLIFDGCLLHLNIYLLKDMGGDVLMVLLSMTNTSYETNMEYLVNCGVIKTEFQNAKQSIMTERLVLGNTNGLKR